MIVIGYYNRLQLPCLDIVYKGKKTGNAQSRSEMEATEGKRRTYKKMLQRNVAGIVRDDQRK